MQRTAPIDIRALDCRGEIYAELLRAICLTGLGLHNFATSVIEAQPSREKHQPCGKQYFRQVFRHKSQPLW